MLRRAYFAPSGTWFCRGVLASLYCHVFRNFGANWMFVWRKIPTESCLHGGHAGCRVVLLDGNGVGEWLCDRSSFVTLGEWTPRALQGLVFTPGSGLSVFIPLSLRQMRSWLYERSVQPPGESSHSLKHFGFSVAPLRPFIATYTWINIYFTVSELRWDISLEVTGVGPSSIYLYYQYFVRII